MKLKRNLLILAATIGTLSCLISCQGMKEKLKISSPRVEWGKHGSAPTIHENYDWICGASEFYRIENK